MGSISSSGNRVDAQPRSEGGGKAVVFPPRRDSNLDCRVLDAVLGSRFESCQLEHAPAIWPGRGGRLRVAYRNVNRARRRQRTARGSGTGRHRVTGPTRSSTAAAEGVGWCECLGTPRRSTNRTTTRRARSRPKAPAPRADRRGGRLVWNGVRSAMQVLSGHAAAWTCRRPIEGRLPAPRASLRRVRKGPPDFARITEHVRNERIRARICTASRIATRSTPTMSRRDAGSRDQ